jgi:hypothetical protein
MVDVLRSFASEADESDPDYHPPHKTASNNKIERHRDKLLQQTNSPSLFFFRVKYTSIALNTQGHNSVGHSSIYRYLSFLVAHPHIVYVHHLLPSHRTALDIFISILCTFHNPSSIHFPVLRHHCFPSSIHDKTLYTSVPNRLCCRCTCSNRKLRFPAHFNASISHRSLIRSGSASSAPTLIMVCRGRNCWSGTVLINCLRSDRFSGDIGSRGSN